MYRKLFIVLLILTGCAQRVPRFTPTPGFQEKASKKTDKSKKHALDDYKKGL